MSVLFYQRLEEMSRLPRGAAFFPDEPSRLEDGGWRWPVPDSFIGKNYGFRVYFRQALSGYRESPSDRSGGFGRAGQVRRGGDANSCRVGLAGVGGNPPRLSIVTGFRSLPGGMIRDGSSIVFECGWVCRNRCFGIYLRAGRGVLDLRVRSTRAVVGRRSGGADSHTNRQGLVFVAVTALLLYPDLAPLRSRTRCDERPGWPGRFHSSNRVDAGRGASGLIMIVAMLGAVAYREVIQNLGYDELARIRWLALWIGFVLLFALGTGAAGIVLWWQNAKSRFELEHLRDELERANLQHRYEQLPSNRWMSCCCWARTVASSKPTTRCGTITASVRRS